MTSMTATAAETYNDRVVRQFAVMTIVWAIVGMAVGVLIAAQLVWPALNFDIPWLTYSRLRPLHTNAVIFAFGGSALFATSYYVVQRTSHVRMFSDGLAAFTFWGWQLVIVLAAITLPLGITSSKEYAELEWPIDILITIVWVAYSVVFCGTLARRRVRHIYVANWLYASYILTFAILHVVNNIEIPVSLWKSYSVYAGVQDAMVQWWYGHNAVGFFLTAGFLGMVMSLILLAPSWGGMINGIMTLSGAWHKLRTDPVLRFLIVAVSFYGMSTFEGPMMSIKTVNALSHYTDGTIGHVHSGALGWVAMISLGAMYYLIPRLFGRAIYSVHLIEIHFWTSTIGIVLYIASMWAAGVMEGLMWRAVNDDGTLSYSFIEVVEATHPFYLVRLLGGLLFLGGTLIMAWNLWRTVAGAKPAEAAVVPLPALAH